METQADHADTLTAGDQPGERSLPEDRPLSVHDARLSRVLDYLAHSLAKHDPLEANLGSINSGLMRMALWLDESVEQAMASGPPDVERLSRVLPAIDTHLRVTRQVDRFTQIVLRAVEARKPQHTDRARDPLRRDGPGSPGSGGSEDFEA